MTIHFREKILVVEDDEGVAQLESRALQRRGYGVINVATGQEALQRVQNDEIDLIIMDFRLSDTTTGLDLFAKLKELGFDVPVIMVTGFSNETMAIEALRQGVRDFVPKTMEYLDYLPDAVERVLEAVRTERRLAASEARFQLFMDNSPAVAFLKDSQGRLLYANRSFLQEIAQREWFRKTDDELWPAETAALHREHDRVVLEANQPRSFNESWQHAHGEFKHWLTYRFPFRDEGGERIIGGMAIDVTQQKAAEESLRIRDEQLRQAQKMEAVGQLAGGVAHDFNNLLTIILGYSEMLMAEEAAPAPNNELLLEVHKAAERAALLTRQLLTFSRRQMVKPTLVDLNEAVMNMERMLSRLIGEHIEIHTVLAPTLHGILADPGQIEQIILNLVVNARDAMPQGGDLSIETANVELSELYTESHHQVEPGEYVLLAISDSGVGMDEETQSHIFEPFFTTKEAGRGTGLGLATVYGIVKQCNGHIWVYSEPGRGTTFKLYFPVAQQNGEASRKQPGPSNVLHGKETILLVEDEPSVRNFSLIALRKYGYQVLEASDPMDAIRISRSHRGEIDLLLTDVVMPQLNGRRLAEILRSERPQLCVLYVSGYTDDAIVRQGVLEREASFLQKPFTPQSLAAKVKEVLIQKQSN